MKNFPKFYLLLFLVSFVLSSVSLTIAQYKVLHHFAGTPYDGSFPYGSLIASGGVLYGMTSSGGSNDTGSVFQIKIDGTEFKLMHSFTGTISDGATPTLSSLILSESFLYGMTTSHGSDFGGTIFKLDTNATDFQLLHCFRGNEGKWPYGSLVEAGSVFFGMNTYGGSDTNRGYTGNGTIFRIKKDGTGYRLLHTFAGSPNDGRGPHTSLIRVGSTLYGMTTVGGRYGGSTGIGTIFRIDTSGSNYQILHNFSGGTNDGMYPNGKLTLSDSYLYGTTTGGGINNMGTIFRINTDGSGFRLLHSFNDTGGKSPTSSLILNASILYGMALEGGNSNSGCIFEINTDGSDFKVLHNFTGNDGSLPQGDLIMLDSTLFGMTSNGGNYSMGVIFELDLRMLSGIQDKRTIGTTRDFKLEQNYPNPFNPSTTIHYSLEKSSQITLTVYNLLGQKVRTLVDDFQNAGGHSICWNATNEQNSLVCSGIYLYEMKTADQNLRKKMILLH